MDLEHDGDIERRSGVTLWRQIADRIRSGIAGEPDGREGRLPPEAELAERFGVNRHTVRAAIAALVQEGVLRSEQGRGTFIVRRNRLTYPIGRRTRFASGLEGQAEARRSRLLRSRVETPPPEAAKALGLNSNARTIRLETLSEADGTPVSVATHWFDASRLADIAEAFQKTGSITLVLRECGVDDYRGPPCGCGRPGSAEAFAGRDRPCHPRDQYRHGRGTDPVFGNQIRRRPRHLKRRVGTGLRARVACAVPKKARPRVRAGPETERWPMISSRRP